MTDDPESDVSLTTRDLFDDIISSGLRAYGLERNIQALPGDRIGWSVDLWEHEGDAVWRITVEAVGS